MDRLLVGIMLFNIGIVLMIATDVQKYTALKYYAELRNHDKQGYTGRTIDDMYCTLSRNFNFLGELMLYTSYVVIVGDSRGYFMFLIVTALAIGPAMIKKEMSLSSKRQWPVYREQTLFLLPRFFEGRHNSGILESWIAAGKQYCVWIVIFQIVYWLYTKGGLIAM